MKPTKLMIAVIVLTFTGSGIVMAETPEDADARQHAEAMVKVEEFRAQAEQRKTEARAKAEQRKAAGKARGENARKIAQDKSLSGEEKGAAMRAMGQSNRDSNPGTARSAK